MVSLVMFCLLGICFGVLFMRMSMFATQHKSDGAGAAAAGLFIATILSLGIAAYRAAQLDHTHSHEQETVRIR